MLERILLFETAMRTRVLKSGKSPERMLMQKKADVEDGAKQACVQLDARKARVAELEARAIESEK